MKRKTLSWIMVMIMLLTTNAQYIMAIENPTEETVTIPENEGQGEVSFQEQFELENGEELSELINSVFFDENGTLFLNWQDAEAYASAGYTVKYYITRSIGNEYFDFDNCCFEVSGHQLAVDLDELRWRIKASGNNFGNVRLSDQVQAYVYEQVSEDSWNCIGTYDVGFATTTLYLDEGNYGGKYSVHWKEDEVATLEWTEVYLADEYELQVGFINKNTNEVWTDMLRISDTSYNFYNWISTIVRDLGWYDSEIEVSVLEVAAYRNDVSNTISLGSCTTTVDPVPAPDIPGPERVYWEKGYDGYLKWTPVEGAYSYEITLHFTDGTETATYSTSTWYTDYSLSYYFNDIINSLDVDWKENAVIVTVFVAANTSEGTSKPTQCQEERTFRIMTKAPQNVHWAEDGILVWNLTGADSYTVSFTISSLDGTRTSEYSDTTQYGFYDIEKRLNSLLSMWGWNDRTVSIEAEVRSMQGDIYSLYTECIDSKVFNVNWPASPQNIRWEEDEELTVSWNKVLGASQYGIQYTVSHDGSNDVISSTSYVDGQTTSFDLLNEEAYLNSYIMDKGWDNQVVSVHVGVEAYYYGGPEGVTQSPFADCTTDREYTYIPKIENVRWLDDGRLAWESNFSNLTFELTVSNSESFDITETVFRHSWTYERTVDVKSDIYWDLQWKYGSDFGPDIYVKAKVMAQNDEMVNAECPVVFHYYESGFAPAPTPPDIQVPGNVSWKEDETAVITWEPVEEADQYTVYFSLFDSKGDLIADIDIPVGGEEWNMVDGQFRFDAYKEAIRQLVQNHCNEGDYEIDIQIAAFDWGWGIYGARSEVMKKSVHFEYPDSIDLGPESVVVYFDYYKIYPRAVFNDKESEQWPADIFEWSFSMDDYDACFNNGPLEIDFLHDRIIVSASLTTDNGAILFDSIEIIPLNWSVNGYPWTVVENILSGDDSIPANTDITEDNFDYIKSKLEYAVNNGLMISGEFTKQEVFLENNEYAEFIEGFGYSNPTILSTIHNSIPVILHDGEEQEILFCVTKCEQTGFQAEFQTHPVHSPTVDRHYMLARLEGEKVTFIEGQYDIDPVCCWFYDADILGDFIFFYYDVPKVIAPEWLEGSNATVLWSGTEEANYYEVEVNLYVIDYDIMMNDPEYHIWLGSPGLNSEYYPRWMKLADTITTGTAGKSLDVQQEIHQMINRLTDTRDVFYIEANVYPVWRDDENYQRGELLGITERKRYRVQYGTPPKPENVQLSPDGTVTFEIERIPKIDWIYIQYEGKTANSSISGRFDTNIPVLLDENGNGTYVSIVERLETKDRYSLNLLKMIKEVYRQNYNGIPVEFSVTLECNNEEIWGNSVSDPSNEVRFCFDTEVGKLPIPQNMAFENDILTFEYPDFERFDEVYVKVSTFTNEKVKYIYNPSKNEVTYSNGVVSIDIGNQMKDAYLFEATDGSASIEISAYVLSENSTPGKMKVDYQTDIVYELASPESLTLDERGDNYSFVRYDRTNVNESWIYMVFQDPLDPENCIKSRIRTDHDFVPQIEYGQTYFFWDLVRQFAKNGASATVYVWNVNTDDMDGFTYNMISRPAKSNTVKKYNFATVEELHVTPQNPVLAVNNEYYLGKEIVPELAYYEAIEWSSSNPEVVEVDAMGKLKALSKGTAVITAVIHTEDGDVTDSVSVTTYDIRSGIKDGVENDSDAKEVTNIAGKIIDDLLNDSRLSTNADIDPEQKEVVQGAIQEAIIRGDTIHVGIESTELTDEELNSLWDLVLENCELQNPEYALGYDTYIRVFAENADKEESRTDLFNITETENEIDISFPMSDLPKCENGYERKFKVARLHNGEIDYLDCTISEDGICTIKSSKFSEYILMYEDELSEPEPEHEVDQFLKASAGIGKDIAMYFTIQIESEMIPMAEKMQFMIGEKKQEVMFSDAEVVTNLGEGCYKFKCSLTSTQMDTLIIARMIYSDQTEGSTLEYSINQYLNTLKNADTVSSSVKYAAEVMSDFGKTMTAYNNGDLASIPDIELSEEEQEYLNNYVIPATGGNLNDTISEISPSKARLAMGSLMKTVVKYSAVEEDEYKFFIDGICIVPTVTYEKETVIYEVTSPMIAPLNYSKAICFTVKNGEKEENFVYSPLIYAKMAINQYSTMENADKYVSLFNSVVKYHYAIKGIR